MTHFVIHDSVNAQQQAQLQYTMFNLYVLLLLIPGIIAHQEGPALFIAEGDVDALELNRFDIGCFVRRLQVILMCIQVNMY